MKSLAPSSERRPGTRRQPQNNRVSGDYRERILIISALFCEHVRGVICPAMIDVASEQLITFGEACRRLTPKGARRPLIPSVLLRWCVRGIGGVRLERVRLGQSWLTSLEALQRFAERRSATGPDLPVRSPREASSACRRAMRELEAL